MSWAESLQNILTSPNSWLTLLFVLIIVLIGILVVKKGFVSVQTDKIKVGARDSEQRVMREQVAYAHIVCMSAAQNVLKNEAFADIDPTHIDLIMEKVYDEFVEWIMFNHISTDDMYVRHKIAKVQNIIETLVPAKVEFGNVDGYIKDAVTDFITELVAIRKLYS